MNDKNTKKSASSLTPSSSTAKQNWVIYKKDGCPACSSALDKFKNAGISPEVIDGPSNEHLWKNTAVKDGTPWKTWPKIYNPDGKFIGGNSDLDDAIKQWKSKT